MYTLCCLFFSPRELEIRTEQRNNRFVPNSQPIWYVWRNGKFYVFLRETFDDVRNLGENFLRLCAKRDEKVFLHANERRSLRGISLRKSSLAKALQKLLLPKQNIVQQKFSSSENKHELSVFQLLVFHPLTQNVPCSQCLVHMCAIFERLIGFKSVKSLSQDGLIEFSELLHCSFPAFSSYCVVLHV